MKHSITSIKKVLPTGLMEAATRVIMQQNNQEITVKDRGIKDNVLIVVIPLDRVEDVFKQN